MYRPKYNAPNDNKHNNKNPTNRIEPMHTLYLFPYPFMIRLPKKFFPVFI